MNSLSKTSENGVPENRIPEYTSPGNKWRLLPAVIILSASSLLTSSCDESDSPARPSEPVIVSISPESGQEATIVTILGRNFSPVATENQVEFGGTEAIVLEASPGALQVVVPADGESGHVTVTVAGITLEGPGFTYIQPGLEYLVSTFAGNGAGGYLDGTAAHAEFNGPEGIAIAPDGSLIVTDRRNNRIRKITAEGVVSTLAGNGDKANTDGNGLSAAFGYPWKSDVDANGNIYVADRDNHRIRKITPDGVVTTLAGSTPGFADGQGTAAQFNQPIDVAVDKDGNVYVADNNNHRIRKITPSGLVTTLAGSVKGYKDGTGSEAELANPSGIAVDPDGNILVADRINHRIRKITPEGIVSTLAGSGEVGSLDGEAESARFNQPYGIAISESGLIVVADLQNDQVRAISGGKVSTIAGTAGGFADGAGAAARFSQPTDVAIAPNGTVYVADLGNNRIRKIVPLE